MESCEGCMLGRSFWPGSKYYYWKLDSIFFVFPEIFCQSSNATSRLSKRQIDENKRVVCYFANWAVYRTGAGKFSPQNINPYLCTHLIYAFGGLGKDDTIQPFDKYQDLEKGKILHFKKTSPFLFWKCVEWLKLKGPGKARELPHFVGPFGTI